mmetsp:Transcript_8558/g.24478  ORF Transcript_8558/g.24478 Transcript_8558/m.24478 type:complete len:339 (-) Transcript_8558:317-1333(-)
MPLSASRGPPPGLQGGQASFGGRPEVAAGPPVLLVLADEVPSRAVADGHGHAALVPQQHAERHAHGVGVAQDHRLLPCKLNPVASEKLHGAPGRARHEARVDAPHGEPAHVQRVETVHVLLRVDALQDGLLVDVPRERELHDDPVNAFVQKQVVEALEQPLLRDLLRKLYEIEIYSDVRRGLTLAVDVKHGVWPVPHEHDGQPRGSPPLAPQLCDLLAYFGQPLLRHPPAVQDPVGPPSRLSLHSSPRSRGSLPAQALVAVHEPGLALARLGALGLFLLRREGTDHRLPQEVQAHPFARTHRIRRRRRPLLRPQRALPGPDREAETPRPHQPLGRHCR